VYSETNPQFEYSLIQWLGRRLGVRVFNHELQRTHNRVEETVDDDFVDVIDVSVPDVAVGAGIEQLTVLLQHSTARPDSNNSSHFFDKTNPQR